MENSDSNTSTKRRGRPKGSINSHYKVGLKFMSPEQKSEWKKERNRRYQAKKKQKIEKLVHDSEKLKKITDQLMSE